MYVHVKEKEGKCISMGVEEGARRNLNDRLSISFFKELQISHDSLEGSERKTNIERRFWVHTTIHRLLLLRPSFEDAVRVSL